MEAWLFTVNMMIHFGGKDPFTVFTVVALHQAAVKDISSNCNIAQVSSLYISPGCALNAATWSVDAATFSRSYCLSHSWSYCRHVLSKDDKSFACSGFFCISFCASFLSKTTDGDRQVIASLLPPVVLLWNDAKLSFKAESNLGTATATTILNHEETLTVPQWSIASNSHSYKLKLLDPIRAMSVSFPILYILSSGVRSSHIESRHFTAFLLTY